MTDNRESTETAPSCNDYVASIVTEPFTPTVKGVGVPVGHIWNFDHEEYELRNFGVKRNFSKVLIGHVMLKFLATTENIRKIRSEQPIYNRGKVLEPSLERWTAVVSQWSSSKT